CARAVAFVGMGEGIGYRGADVACNEIDEALVARIEHAARAQPADEHSSRWPMTGSGDRYDKGGLGRFRPWAGRQRAEGLLESRHERGHTGFEHLVQRPACAAAFLQGNRRWRGAAGWS